MEVMDVMAMIARLDTTDSCSWVSLNHQPCCFCHSSLSASGTPKSKSRQSLEDPERHGQGAWVCNGGRGCWSPPKHFDLVSFGLLGSHPSNPQSRATASRLLAAHNLVQVYDGLRDLQPLSAMQVGWGSLSRLCTPWQPLNARSTNSVWWLS